jgi:hypothetical protein
MAPVKVFVAIGNLESGEWLRPPAETYLVLNDDLSITNLYEVRFTRTRCILYDVVAYMTPDHPDFGVGALGTPMEGGPSIDLVFAPGALRIHIHCNHTTVPRAHTHPLGGDAGVASSSLIHPLGTLGP